MCECTLWVGDKFQGTESLLLHDIDRHIYIYTHTCLVSKAYAYYSLAPPQQQQLSKSKNQSRYSIHFHVGSSDMRRSFVSTVLWSLKAKEHRPLTCPLKVLMKQLTNKTSNSKYFGFKEALRTFFIFEENVVTALNCDLLRGYICSGRKNSRKSRDLRDECKQGQCGQRR